MSTGASEAALARIAGVSGQRINPPALMPARRIIELSGEAVRARLCAFTDAAGQEYCLRPDMTTPIAELVLRGEASVGRHHYAGPVYRLPAVSGDAIEFEQVGFEWFGGSGPDEDAEAVALALEAAHTGAAGEAAARVGDICLYHAVVDGLNLSPAWKARLKRSFARRRGPIELLEEAVRTQRPERSALAASLAGLPPEEAQRAVEEVFAIAGVQPVGGRTAGEIAERLRERLSEQAPDSAAVDRLKAFLSLRAPAGGAARALKAYASETGLDLRAAIDALETRLSRIAALKPPYWASAEYSSGVGRRFEYYDGLVFDLVRPDQPDRPIAAGGRYDGLLSRMGSPRPISAIGAALRADRLQEGRRS